MSENCPTCGQSLAGREGVNVDLETGMVVIDDLFAYLTKKQAELLSILVEASPRALTKGQLMHRLYGGFDDQEPAEKIVDVWVCKIRRELKDTRLKILTHWGRGYSAVLDKRNDDGD